jgi:propionyl-CoA carboxylase alpha chain
MPGHGRLFEFRAPATPKLRVDTGVAAGDDITTFYDPMLAKVVAHAPSRAQAVAMLAAGLRRFTLHGPVTNREALVAVLEHEAFRAGDTPTSFFEDHPEVLVRSFDADTQQAHLIAATHHVLLDEQHDSRIPFAPAGWRNIPTPGSVTTLAVGDTSASVNVRLLADGSREWSIDGSVVEAHVVAESPEHIFVTVNGVRRSISIAAHGASLFCDDGLHSTHVNVVPRFTASDLDAAGGGPTTPVPGTITAVLVAVGDRVEAGDALVVLEAMKMEHRIKSDVTGTISALYVNVGENVDSHHLVAEVTADEAQEDGETA